MGLIDYLEETCRRRCRLCGRRRPKEVQQPPAATPNPLHGANAFRFASTRAAVAEASWRRRLLARFQESACVQFCFYFAYLLFVSFCVLCVICAPIGLWWLFHYGLRSSCYTEANPSATECWWRTYWPSFVSMLVSCMNSDPSSILVFPVVYWLQSILVGELRTPRFARSLLFVIIQGYPGIILADLHQYQIEHAKLADLASLPRMEGFYMQDHEEAAVFPEFATSARGKCMSSYCSGKQRRICEFDSATKKQKCRTTCSEYTCTKWEWVCLTPIMPISIKLASGLIDHQFAANTSRPIWTADALALAKAQDYTITAFALARTGDCEACSCTNASSSLSPHALSPQFLRSAEYGEWRAIHPAHDVVTHYGQGWNSGGLDAESADGAIDVAKARFELNRVAAGSGLKVADGAMVIDWGTDPQKRFDESTAAVWKFIWVCVGLLLPPHLMLTLALMCTVGQRALDNGADFLRDEAEKADGEGVFFWYTFYMFFCLIALSIMRGVLGYDHYNQFGNASL